MRKSSMVNDHLFRLSRNTTHTDATFNFHAHDGYEIYYFESGEIQYYIKDQRYAMVAGDVLVIPPRTMHRVVTVDEQVPYSRFVLSVSEEYCRRLMARVPSHFVFTGTDHCHFPMQEQIHRMLLSLLNAEAGEVGMVARDAIMTLLLLQLDELRHRAAQRQGREHSLAEVIRYIDANFTRDLSLEEIAERFFISKYHLLRRFKRLTNSTVHQYILTKRILLARALLRQGMSPADVAAECGFQTYSGFYQAFYHQTGEKPSKVKKE